MDRPRNDGAPQRGGQSRQAVLIALLFCLGLVLAALLLWSAGRLLAVKVGPVQGLASSASGASPRADEEDIAQAVAKVAPAVVSVELYDSGGVVATGSGSGVVLTRDGYVATCAHVVYDSPVIRVVLYDGRSFRAELAGLDAQSDLALLKIQAKDLVPAELGDSDGVVVGQLALTVSNATGSLPGTPSQGIISGVGRSMPLSTATGSSARLNLLQTDAAVNPGSSGGALADGEGRVIGLCIGKIEDPNVENIGFAIPINDALPILNGWMKDRGSPLSSAFPPPVE